MVNINDFKPALKVAFEKMILGINCKLSDRGKLELGDNTDSYYFITSINESEELTIVKAGEQLHINAKLKHIDLPRV